MWLWCSLTYCHCDVGWCLARLSSLPFTLQGHGDLLWLVLIQQRKTLKQLLLHCHLLGFTCNCNPKNISYIQHLKENNNSSVYIYSLVEISTCMLCRWCCWDFNNYNFWYLACSCRMLRSFCTSSAAALGSVRHAVGTSATGAICFCSSGAGWGTGCFCRLDRIRSFAANQTHKVSN